MLYRFCVFLFITGSLFAADLSGDWELALKYLNDTSHARVKLKTDGDKLTGTLNELKIEGTVKGDDVRFTARRPNGDQFGDFEGKLQGEELKGTAIRASRL